MGDSRAPQRPDLPGDLAGGAVRPLRMLPDPVLHQICQPAGYMTGVELVALSADLLATMYNAGGRGLAAPQIGVLRRVFVMDAGWKDGQPDPVIVVDPDILAQSDQVEPGDEACLSIPGRVLSVTRPVQITLAWYDLQGLHQSRVLQGITARIALHELDHLNGRLIVDDLT
ncbi:peptide deformylase [Paracoccus sp. (in: a-proteobacteria)]|uniref:peptide deformylase n=1 Tax=Paracoccus sp. TaxID=267 RepID=UPI0026E0A2EE|nr:peptide deformylase [Paracoccus sp. (in: a-proteobacteria)]MDO5648566.1 peptide deformylase [Paracoccus sp. (in: a-proteobacteria)]